MLDIEEFLHTKKKNGQENFNNFDHQDLINNYYLYFQIINNLLLWINNNKHLTTLDQNNKLYELFKDEFTKELRKQSVLNKSQETLNNFGQKTLGVHIRRGDAVGTDFYSRYKEKYGADVKVYIKRVRELLETKYDKVYISTDCEKSLNAFKQTFGSKCINFNKKFVSSVWHKQKKGQIDARVEQHLLSCTNYLLTSEWSTFSDFVKHYSDLESEIV